jgi:hypothetical protein
MKSKQSSTSSRQVGIIKASDLNALTGNINSNNPNAVVISSGE